MNIALLSDFEFTVWMIIIGVVMAVGAVSFCVGVFGTR